MVSKKVLALFVLVLLVLFSSIVFATSIILGDQGTNVIVSATGAKLTTGDLTVSIYDAATGGNLIYTNTFTSGIVNGTWDVDLNFTAEYGKIYYKDYSINGDDLDFSGQERKAFMSPLGDISVLTNISASFFHGSGANLTGLPTGSGWANTSTETNTSLLVNVLNNFLSTKNVSAANFHGSGANLTNLPAGSGGWINTTTESNNSLLVNILNNLLSTKNISAANFHGVGTNLTGLPIQSGGWTNTSTESNSSLLVNVLNNFLSTKNVSAANFHGSGSNLTNLPAGSGGWINTTTESNNSLLVNILNNLLSTKNISAANFHGVGTNLTGLPIQSGGWTNTSTESNSSLLVNVLNNFLSTKNVSAANFHGSGANLTGLPLSTQTGGWANTSTESNSSLLVNVQNNFLSTMNVSAANFHGSGANLTGLPAASGGWTNTSTESNNSLLVNVQNNFLSTKNVSAANFHGNGANLTGLPLSTQTGGWTNTSTESNSSLLVNVQNNFLSTKNVTAANFHGSGANLTGLPAASGGWTNSSTESNNSLIITANANSTFMNRTGFGRPPITTATVVINATPGDTYGLYIDRYNVDTVNVTTGVTKYAFRAEIGSKSATQAKTNSIYAFTGLADQRNIFSNGGSTVLNQATVGGHMSVIDVGGLAGTSWSNGQHSNPSSIGMQGGVTDYYGDTSNISDTRYWAYGGVFTAATQSYTINKPSGFIQKNYVGTYGQADSRGGTLTSGDLSTNSYGGYFLGQADTVGTSVTYGIYALGTGGDTNYAALLDGQVLIRTSGSNNGKISIADAAIINEDGGAEGNTRIEGDTDAQLLFVNSSSDKVGIGKSDPKTKVQISGNLSSSGIFVYNLTGGTDACTVKWNANTSELYCQT